MPMILFHDDDIDFEKINLDLRQSISSFIFHILTINSGLMISVFYLYLLFYWYLDT